MSILLALALAGSVPTGSPDGYPADKICGYAAEALLMDGDYEARYEMYRGRIERRLDELEYKDREKPIIRASCDVYLLGVLKGMQLLVKATE